MRSTLLIASIAKEVLMHRTFFALLADPFLNSSNRQAVAGIVGRPRECLQHGAFAGVAAAGRSF